MEERQYSRVEIILYANSYYSLLSARDHFIGNCDVMRGEEDWGDIPAMRRSIEGWAENIPTELGDLWVERPRNIRDELLKKLDELEGGE